MLQCCCCYEKAPLWWWWCPIFFPRIGTIFSEIADGAGDISGLQVFSLTVVGTSAVAENTSSTQLQLLLLLVPILMKLVKKVRDGRNILIYFLVYLRM